MQVEITYVGEHNFDWDSNLEALAGHARYSSDMDFEGMKRTIIFNFDTVAHGEKFVAAVHNAYPDFGIEKSCRVEQSGSSSGS